LRPGGSLVYSTCTITTEENDAVIRGFMATRANWKIAPRESAPAAMQPLMDDQGFLRLLPHRHDMDGFFAVRLIRGESETGGKTDGKAKGRG
jgi:16S rRNA (cytosine967-C5)-methyltransferase